MKALAIGQVDSKRFEWLPVDLSSQQERLAMIDSEKPCWADVISAANIMLD